MKFIKRPKNKSLVDQTLNELKTTIDKFFEITDPRTPESLLIFLNTTELEYGEFKQKEDYRDILEFAELRCKEDIIKHGFSGNTFASYYHKEHYSDTVDVMDTRDIIINISKDETVSPHHAALGM